MDSFLNAACGDQRPNVLSLSWFEFFLCGICLCHSSSPLTERRLYPTHVYKAILRKPPICHRVVRKHSSAGKILPLAFHSGVPKWSLRRARPSILRCCGYTFSTGRAFLSSSLL